MLYEDEVVAICGEEWRNTPAEEVEGGYGVAIMMAYIEGCKPSLPEIATWLGVTPDEIEVPFKRLLVSGYLSGRSAASVRYSLDARRDQSLTASGDYLDLYSAWPYVAGVASGFVGCGHYITRQSLNERRDAQKAKAAAKSLAVRTNVRQSNYSRPPQRARV